MTKESIKHSIKSSGVKSQNLVQPDVYQTSDLLEKEKTVKPSEERIQNLQNLVQPGKYQTTDLLEKEINVKSSKENDQNIIQPSENNEVESLNLIIQKESDH